MELEFTKMHGLGNDMVVLDSLSSGFIPTSEQARAMLQRRYGIGGDQILVLLPSESADFKMLIFNNDGSEVEMCGNGVRCLARYIHDRGISDKTPLEIETLAGTIKPELVGDLVKVDMGKPIFEASRVPVKGEGILRGVEMEAGGRVFKMSAVSMGNPHCVIETDDVEAVPLSEIGPVIERHPWFPNRTNVEFVQVVSPRRMIVRVWERGAGITLACGTGACGAAVAMMDLGRVGREVTAALPGGDLEIKWDEKTGHVFMTGPAREVYRGTIKL